MSDDKMLYQSTVIPTLILTLIVFKDFLFLLQCYFEHTVLYISHHLSPSCMCVCLSVGGATRQCT